MNPDFLKEVRMAQKGNGDSFTKLIKQCEASMYRVARSYILSDSECGDVMQEAIEKAYRGIRNLKEPQYFKTWLIRILINECNRYCKKRGQVLPISSIKTTTYNPDMEQHLDLTNAIQELDSELRILITLYYMEDLSINHISRLLSTPEGTIKSRLSRARQILASRLEPLTERSRKL